MPQTKKLEIPMFRLLNRKNNFFFCSSEHFLVQKYLFWSFQVLNNTFFLCIFLRVSAISQRNTQSIRWPFDVFFFFYQKWIFPKKYISIFCKKYPSHDISSQVSKPKSSLESLNFSISKSALFLTRNH